MAAIEGSERPISGSCRRVNTGAVNPLGNSSIMPNDTALVLFRPPHSILDTDDSENELSVPARPADSYPVASSETMPLLKKSASSDTSAVKNNYSVDRVEDHCLFPWNHCLPRLSRRARGRRWCCADTLSFRPTSNTTPNDEDRLNSCNVMIMSLDGKTELKVRRCKLDTGADSSIICRKQADVLMANGHGTSIAYTRVLATITGHKLWSSGSIGVMLRDERTRLLMPVEFLIIEEEHWPFTRVLLLSDKVIVRHHLICTHRICSTRLRRTLLQTWKKYVSVACYHACTLKRAERLHHHHQE